MSVRSPSPFGPIARHLSAGDWEYHYRSALGLAPPSEWPDDDALDTWRWRSDRKSRAQRWLTRKRRERRRDAWWFTVAVCSIIIITERVTG